jgi:hypothetical protein
VWEEIGASGNKDLASVLLHELGHCAFGLDHVNEELSSFTRTADEDFIDQGSDGVRGSADDTPSPLPGSRLIHWYRLEDNDPFVIDDLDIESPWYSRVLTDLPFSDNWAASGNRVVSEDVLEYGNSQSVMYSRFTSDTIYSGITADESNMARFAETGLDEFLDTEDDYTVEVVVVEDCANADFSVRFESVDPPEVLARCVTELTPIPIEGQPVRHFRLDRIDGISLPYVRVNSGADWSFFVFRDGFESGTTAEWTTAVP